MAVCVTNNMLMSNKYAQCAQHTMLQSDNGKLPKPKAECDTVHIYCSITAEICTQTSSGHNNSMLLNVWTRHKYRL